MTYPVAYRRGRRAGLTPGGFQPQSRPTRRAARRRRGSVFSTPGKPKPAQRRRPRLRPHPTRQLAEWVFRPYIDQTALMLGDDFVYYAERDPSIDVPSGWSKLDAGQQACMPFTDNWGGECAVVSSSCVGKDTSLYGGTLQTMASCFEGSVEGWQFSELYWDHTIASPNQYYQGNYWWVAKTDPYPGDPTLDPGRGRSVDPVVVPTTAPSLDPMALPIGKTVPVAQALPYSMWARPASRLPEGREVGPEPEVAAQQAGVVRVGSRNVKQPRGPVKQSFTPGKRTREIKVRLALPTGVLRLVNSLTEATDLIQAIYAAAPEACRQSDARWSKTGKVETVFDPSTGRRKPRVLNRVNATEALQRILECPNIDWEQALINIAANELEDRAIGSLAGRIGEQSRRRREIFTPLSGPAL